jgi:hypothetical protein
MPFSFQNEDKTSSGTLSGTPPEPYHVSLSIQPNYPFAYQFGTQSAGLANGSSNYYSLVPQNHVGLSLEPNYQFGTQYGTQSAGLGYGSSNDRTYVQDGSYGNSVTFSGFASLSSATEPSTTTSPAPVAPHGGGYGWQSLSNSPITGGFGGINLMQFTTSSSMDRVIAAINGSLSQLSPYTASYTSSQQAWFIRATSSRSSMMLRVYFDYSSSSCVVEADLTGGDRCEALWYVFNNVQSACSTV